VRIAIFGGSFDPIHVAHVAIVENALSKLDIDKLIIVPTYLNPFKNSFNLNPETRFELLKKVFHKFKNVEISDYEINQHKTSYSFNTVNYLKNLYNPSKIYLIIGEDNIKDLDKWYNMMN
jgi:nicotinate-nucleotide adenylyltransferase